MYKLIACDLDETLLNNQAEVQEANKAAIKKVTAKGIKFVPATGRSFSAVQGILKEIGLYDKPNEYVISYNGGCISENKNNHILECSPLDFETAERLFQIGKKEDVCIHIYTLENIYLFNPNDEELNYISNRLNVKVVNFDNLSSIKNQSIIKLIFQNLDLDYLKQIQNQIENDNFNLNISYSANRYLELNSQGVSKGAGLLDLAKKLNINPEETLAIGDNLNDLSMIQDAGLGIGISNAAPILKNYCDYITKNDNNHGGVAEAIDKFILS